MDIPFTIVVALKMPLKTLRRFVDAHALFIWKDNYSTYIPFSYHINNLYYVCVINDGSAIVPPLAKFEDKGYADP